MATPSRAMNHQDTNACPTDALRVGGCCRFWLNGVQAPQFADRARSSPCSPAVQGLCRHVVRPVAELDARRAGLYQAFNASGQQVACQAAPLVGVVGAHRLNEASCADRVEPEQRVGRHIPVGRQHQQVQPRSVQGGLLEPGLDLITVTLDVTVLAPAGGLRHRGRESESREDAR